MVLKGLQGIREQKQIMQPQEYVLKSALIKIPPNSRHTHTERISLSMQAK
jgi:hypothetical protein